MGTIITSGPPFFVTIFPALQVNRLPRRVENWIRGWSNAHDTYERIEVSDLETDEDVATDETREWAKEFRKAFPGYEYILVEFD